MMCLILQSKILICVSVYRKFRRRDYFQIVIKTNHVLVILDHSTVYRVTVPYAACAQLYPPEDDHLRLETCKEGYYVMNK